MSAKASLRRLQFSNFKLDVLLDITLAINENLPVKDLLHQFESILCKDLNIGKVLIYRYNEKWNCILSSGVHRNVAEGIMVETDLLYYKQITNLTVTLNPNLELFDVIIPVYHHETPIAYVIIGDIDEERAGMSPTIKHLHFRRKAMARSHVRRLENTNISVSLPKELVKKVDEISNKEQRSRSNMIAVLLQDALKKSKANT